MEVKKSEEILSEIYRNCHLALESISDILPAVEDEELKAEILREHEEYERISGKAACLARDKGLEVKEPGPVKKAMMWGSIKMSTMMDNSRPHIAEMMIQGTTMGIVKSIRHLNDYQGDDGDARRLGERLLDTQEQNVERMKAYL